MAALRGARSFDRGLALGVAAGSCDKDVAAAVVAAGVSVVGGGCDGGCCDCASNSCDSCANAACDCCASSSRIDVAVVGGRVLGGRVSWTRGIGGSMGCVMEVSGPPALRGGVGGCGLRR